MNEFDCTIHNVELLGGSNLNASNYQTLFTKILQQKRTIHPKKNEKYYKNHNNNQTRPQLNNETKHPMCIIYDSNK